MNGYSKALMGFDFADAVTLDLARQKFAQCLEQNEVDRETAEAEAAGLNHYWKFATYAFCPTGEGGGIDNSCSPTEGIEGNDVVASSSDWLDNAVKTSQFPLRQKSGRAVTLQSRIRDIGRFEGRDSIIVDVSLQNVDRANSTRRLKLLLDNAFDGYKQVNPKAHAPDIFRDGVEIDRDFANWLNLKYDRQWKETNLQSLLKKKSTKSLESIQPLGKSFMLRYMPPWRGFMDMQPGSPHMRIFGKYAELRERRSYDCQWCGLHRYHLPGQHDQCDHSPTGECSGDKDWHERKQRIEEQANALELDDEQRGAIQEYTAAGYRDINGFLRGTTKLTGTRLSNAKGRIMDIDSAIDRSRLPESIVTYRGMVDRDKLFSDPQALIGKTITVKTFSSTTLQRQIAEDFGEESKPGANDGVLFRIHIPKGSSALYVSASKLGGNGEAELLLSRSSKFKIKGIKTISGKDWIDLDLVS